VSVTVTDLFCGAGGSSIGAELAGTTLRMGLNHWERAIETHAANFQDADHDCTEVSACDPRRYPATDILLASPECTNHSLAKGARRRKPQAASLWDDGPAGDAEQDRSRATMWDVPRFAEAMIARGRPYKAVVVENVVDAAKWGPGDNGALFDAWLQTMRALGYHHEVVWLNSMFCPPTPQSRDRMYVVFWRKGLRRPNLRFEPPAWCPHCERVVDGRQMWKRPDRRPWGRYGAQYLYGCPDCGKAVLPGAFPAATAIDWALPAERIGDRARPLATATRERIRRGLEKLASEPFAIRLTHGGQPRPLTLPLVTLTRRHDMAMVMPVAANTFERRPGNRAKDASRDPLPTLHGTADKAIVIPPMGDVDPRDADLSPAPTQTTTTRAAVVQTSHRYEGHSASRVKDPSEPLATVAADHDRAVVLSNRAHNVPRRADTEPTHPVLTGETLGVVQLQRSGSVIPPSQPVHTVRAGAAHHGVVVRQNTSHGDPGQMATPTHEPIRTLTQACHQSLVMANTENGVPRSAEVQPSQTLRGSGGLALIVPYDRTGESRPAELEPTHTLTTRDRAALVLTDEDIDDCRFRMFALHEIAEAMVMRDHVDGSEYVVLGNKRERMAQYGNAVTPPAMHLLVSRLLEIL
jgi:DNA (cytosine-5)-methyltransferase 1